MISAAARSVLLAAALALSGCGGSSAGSVAGPSAYCEVLAPTLNWQLSAPADGATGVSPTIGSITLTVAAPAGIGTLVSTFPPIALQAIGSSVQTGTFTASGNAYTATLPTLAAKTTYEVFAPQAVSCARPQPIGTFTTQ